MQLISSKRTDPKVLEIEHYINEALSVLNQSVISRLLKLNMCYVIKLIDNYEKIRITGYSLNNNPNKNSDYINPIKEWEENNQFVIVPNKLNDTEDNVPVGDKEYRWAIDYVDTKDTKFSISSNRVCVCFSSVSDLVLKIKINKTNPFLGISVFDLDHLTSINHLSIEV